MKFTVNPKTKLLSILLAGAIAAFSSCKKNDDDGMHVSAYLMITNAAEGSAPQDMYVDNAKLSGSTVAYTQSSNYLTTSSGDHQAQFVTSGTSTANASFNLSLQGGHYYSVYYTGGASASSSNYVVAEDDHSTPPSGKARVRFINLSAALNSAVDFGISGGNKLVSGLAYRAASAYYDVDASTSFALYLAGSSSVTLNIPTTIQAGKIYTVYISGATTATATYHIVAQN